jgi:hypothetical protein
MKGKELGGERMEKWKQKMGNRVREPTREDLETSITVPLNITRDAAPG